MLYRMIDKKKIIILILSRPIIHLRFLISNYRELSPKMEDWFSTATVDLLSCNVKSQSIPPRMLMSQFFLGPHVKGRSRTLLQYYRRCMNRLTGNQTRNEFEKVKFKSYFERFPECQTHLKRVCTRHDVTVIKTIRMTLKQASRAMELDPDLKVIYSTRDPRAVASSRDHIVNYVKDAPSLAQTTAEVCERMRYDLDHLETLEANYITRFMRTSFEAIVSDVEGVSRQIYSFLGLGHVPPEVRTLIADVSHDEGHRNATVKWQKKFSPENKMAAERDCSDIIKRLGLYP